MLVDRDYGIWRICVNLNIGLLNPAVVIFVYTLIPPGAVNVCVCTLPPEEQSSTSMCAVQGTELYSLRVEHTGMESVH